jgi:beta-lactamase superfamily II metal-dependent hydrolase
VDNEFKHPAPSTVERFRRAGARLWRTDIEGTIEVETDGAFLWESWAWGK